MIVTGYKIDQILDSDKHFKLGICHVKNEQAIKVKFADRAKVTFERQLLLKNNFGLLKDLSHELIPRAIDFRSDKAHIALITEFVQGKSVEELTRDNSIPVIKAVKIALDIAKILDYLYDKKVIHQSLSPSNVIIDEQGHAHLINFDKASNQDSLAQDKVPVRLLPYELDYCSPEQTGRVNRIIDYRTDLYGLGMVMYQMLTAQKPFNSSDPLELIHAQIAKIPDPVDTLNNSVPPALSGIVSKLLSKNAEDRYQSNSGLIYDLEKCLSEISEGNAPEFEIGGEDKVDRFLPPQRLIGREKEIDALVSAFKSVLNGPAKIIMVSGYSGVGKTALIEEVANPVLAEGGLLVKGKADQYQNTPYNVLVEASKEFINFVLKEDEKTINYWKERIISHVGNNLALLTIGLPGLDRIVGPQQMPEDLSPTEAENRYTQVVFKYLQAISPPEHPLVIFMDDLQWVDQATLDIVEKIIRSQVHTNLMFIGSYRNNEVEEDHPLVNMITNIKPLEGAFDEIQLLPLSKEHIYELVSEVFNTEVTKIIGLANLIYNKTFGNPFFTIQLLRKLHDEKIVRFNNEKKEWNWDADELDKLNISENVVDLMLNKIMMLPEETRKVICAAAPIGSVFNLEVHAKVCGLDAREIIQHIFPAVQDKMIQLNTAWFPYMLDQYTQLGEEEMKYLSSLTFSFIHDRIQQAAYSLLSEEERLEMHYKIGNILYETDNIEEKIYDIVFHLNESESLIKSQEEKIRLAKLNLRAGERTNRSNAFENAISYLEKGINLLDESAWKDNYMMMFDLHYELSWAQSMIKETSQTESTFEKLIEHSKSPQDRILINTRRASLYTKIGDFHSVIRVTKESLKEFGITFPEKQLSLQLKAMYSLVLTTLKLKLKYRSWSELENLKTTDDPEHIRINNLLVEAGVASYSSSQELMVLTMLEVLNRSWRYGATESTPWSIQAYAVIAGSFFKWYKAGFEIGRSAINLGERVCGALQRARLPFVQSSFISHWRQYIRKDLDVFSESYKKTIANGDSVMAYNSLVIQTLNSLASGKNLLGELETIYRKEKQILSFGGLTGLYLMLAQKRYVLALTGSTKALSSMEGDDFSEQGYLEDEKSTGNSRAYYYNYKTQLLYYSNKFQEAEKFLDPIKEHIPFVIGLYMVNEMEFYSCLVRLQLVKNADSKKQKALRKEIKSQLKTFKVWSKNAPENFRHQFELLLAEWKFFIGKKQQANDLYDRAIEGANENDFTQIHAICLERAGNFYLNENKTELGETLLQKAWKVYEEWGATAIKDQFPSRYPDIDFYEKEDIGSAFDSLPAKTDNSKPGEILDFNSLLKASQSLSSTLKFDQVLHNLMQILMENAAAQKIALILDQGGVYELTAYKEVGDEDVTIIQQSISDNQELVPTQVINYCFHTKQIVELSNALKDRLFNDDPYIRSSNIKSVLCFPIRYNDENVGVIYLENNLIEGAFTKERIEVLNLLSSQIAVSLTNSQLYENLEQKVEQRTKEIRLAKDEIEHQKLEIEKEKDKSDKLLLNILPESIAEELKISGSAKAKQFDDVCVLFIDIVKFTVISQQLSPQELVKELDYYFKKFDEITEKYGLEKIKTIGDSFMAAGGVPEPMENSSKAMVEAAMEMRDFVAHEMLTRKKEGRVFFETRFGIHTGSVVAGVVGYHKFAFDIWGDTVNTASRLQTSSEPGKVNISQSTYEQISKYFECTYRGEIDTKHKGKVRMYFVEGSAQN